MYDIAAKFESKEEAGKVYTTLENTLKELRFFAHVSRLQLGNDFFVSLIYDGEESSIPPRAQQTIQALLSQGQICRLPPETIATIQQRRENRRAQGIGTFTSHDETKVSYRTPVLRDAETKEEIQTFPELTEITHEGPYTSGPQAGSPVYAVDLKDIPQEIRAQAARAQADAIRKKKAAARPFFIRYRDHIEDLYNEEGEEGFDPSIEIFLEQMRLMIPYLFTESAITLFREVWEENNDAFILPERDVWIEFYEPLETPQGTVKALAISQVNRKAAIERIERKSPGLKGLAGVEGFKEDYLYRVQVIDDAMQFIATESYDTDLAKWVHTQDATSFWASWARTVLLMIDREYATSPDPKPWDTQKMPYEEEGVQKVGKGKNARIVKTTHKREVEYKVISYDVSIPEVPREQSPRAAHTEEEKRANWLVLTSKEEIIYQRKKIASYPRHYTKQEGTYTVSEHEKYVPMLREKPPTIRKVIASSHEQESK